MYGCLGHLVRYVKTPAQDSFCSLLLFKSASPFLMQADAGSTSSLCLQMHEGRMSELTLSIRSPLECQKKVLQTTQLLVLLVGLHSCGRASISLHKPKKLPSKSQ